MTRVGNLDTSAEIFGQKVRDFDQILTSLFRWEADDRL